MHKKRAARRNAAAAHPTEKITPINTAMARELPNGSRASLVRRSEGGSAPTINPDTETVGVGGGEVGTAVAADVVATADVGRAAVGVVVTAAVAVGVRGTAVGEGDGWAAASVAFAQPGLTSFCEARNSNF